MHSCITSGIYSGNGDFGNVSGGLFRGKSPSSISGSRSSISGPLVGRSFGGKPGSLNLVK